MEYYRKYNAPVERTIDVCIVTVFPVWTTHVSKYDIAVIIQVQFPIYTCI